jgi:hypothetical protein
MPETDFGDLVQQAREAAALRLQRGVQQPGTLTRTSSRYSDAGAGIINALVPQTPLDFALMAVPFGKIVGRPVAKAAATAGITLADILSGVDEAQAGPASKVAKAIKSVLSPAEKAAPYPAAKFSQYAEEYPAVGPPTPMPKDKPKYPGETYLAKTPTPEATAFMKEREKIMEDMKQGYTPYFDPAKRTNVDPSNYPGRNVDTLTIAPKKQATLDEYLKYIDAPETRKALRAAYARGLELGNANDWYAMAQLEKGYLKEYGQTEGRKQFLEGFATPMAATTSGNQPQANYLMGHYLEYNRLRGDPYPAGGYELPVPVGGRRSAMNLRDYELMRERGGYAGLGADQPKMHNFARSFIGDLDRAVMDEQMVGGALAHAPAGFADKARKGAFGLIEAPLHAEAKAAGVRPGNYQDVGWAGFKDESAGPMINVINDTIERTHRLTGMPRDEIYRRGVIRREIPLYGAGGVIMGGAASTGRDQSTSVEPPQP